MAKNAAAVAQKWVRNLGAATDSIKNGVQAVTVSPTEKAAQRADAYQQGVLDAVSSGKWQRGLRRVTNEQWKQATLTKGIPRIATGAQAAQPKMEKFLGEFLPFMDNVVQQMDSSMPRGTLEQNIQRAVYVMQQASQFKRSQ